MRILVTGATGYIGGRLIPKLLERGHRIRVLVRDGARIRGRWWSDLVEVFPGDLLKPATLRGMCDGVDAAFFLVHSMSAGADFARRDLEAARNYVAAAGGARLTVYLGGLLPDAPLSAHLRSRAEVGAVLRDALPATEIRAGPIIGSGSASFELVRYITERHPLMVVPRCAHNEVQPIGLRDVLAYLVAAIERDPLDVVEIGSERLSFAAMLLEYAAVRGLSRRMFTVRALNPRAVARWVSAVTPVPRRIACPLLQGMLQPVIADTQRARALFPRVAPLSYRCATELALERIEEGRVETHWTGALASGPTRKLFDSEGVMREVRTYHVRAAPEHVHEVVTSLGGSRGWLSCNFIWWLRGLVDHLLGGPGLRRGRRHPDELLPGEPVDFWRVERVERPGLLRLRAEMKVPGRAWLQWEAFPQGEGACLVQTATFQPDGLAGFLYWYLLYPIHATIFNRLGAAVRRRAETTPPRPAARPATPRRILLGPVPRRPAGVARLDETASRVTAE
jgi:uncharacterized protein YbjT (DUF2867 family)